jgi:hypothetical protein
MLDIQPRGVGRNRWSKQQLLSGLSSNEIPTNMTVLSLAEAAGDEHSWGCSASACMHQAAAAAGLPQVLSSDGRGTFLPTTISFTFESHCCSLYISNVFYGDLGLHTGVTNRRSDEFSIPAGSGAQNACRMHK